MSATNRAALLTKMVKVLKKHYKPVAPPDRSVLEHLLYATCLENSPHEAADESFAKLQENYFDWNEVRVTTVAELSEAMASLSDPEASAQRLKRSLQSVFETHYAFDIDFFRKQNLGKSIKDIEGFSGVTPFTVAYLTQNALSGHAIPVNNGVLSAFVVLGIISEAEAAKRHVPGLERAIPKNKGVEIGSMLHQVGVEYQQNRFSTNLRSILLEISPDAKERLPKRPAKKTTTKAASDRTAKAATKKTTAKSKKSSRPAAAASKKSSTKKLVRKKPR